ncbi:MAG: SgcJ/EcaC family oxidoreductase [Planctomycetales bacterium]|nr:SgcJ/EcaC family oxidoreductase [Planctomycetales bacterium]
MKSRNLWGTVLIGGVVIAAVMAAESRSQPPAGKTKSKGSAAGEASPKSGARDAKAATADEEAVRATVAAFVKAYNAHDSAAVAKLFGPQAKIVTEDGDVVDGRDAIAEMFAGLFADEPETKLDVTINSIKFIGSELAVETGTTKTVSAPGASPESGRYTVLHLKRDGGWLMALVRDETVEPTHREHLQALSWLVGDWIDESREGIVRTSCRWADNESFLLQEITVRQAGHDTMKISQRIGWDSLTKRFKAWVFDTEGGYGESSWTPTETGWLIKATSVRSDGSTASATNHIEPTGSDRYVFRSVDRVVGNEVLPPVEVHVVRQPPQPK